MTTQRFYVNSTRFVPRPEKKGRNLRQIEEQFRMLDEKERKLRGKFVDEDQEGKTNNSSMNLSTMNNSSILPTTNELNDVNQSLNNVDGIDNTFIMSFEKRAKSTNSHHNTFRSAPPKPKPPKLIVVPTNTTTQFRSSLHLKQIVRKQPQGHISSQFSPNTTARISAIYSDAETEEEINIQDRTTIDYDDESSEEKEIAEELPTLFTLSPSGVDPKITEIFTFEVRVHQLAEHPNGLFDVKIYDEAKPFERVFVLKDLRINRDCYIIFTEPSFIKFNALTLPWVERPENLVNHTVVVEVQGTYPNKTKIAKSTIKFSHKQSPKYENLNRSKRSSTPPESKSPSRSSPKILRLDMPSKKALPFTTTPSYPKEEDLQRSLSCVPVNSLSLKIQTPAVPQDEDLIQRNKLERSNSADSQLSPSSQKYKQLQELRENMKMNLMIQQKLLS